MSKKITALLFDFTIDNLNAHEDWKEIMISGRNVLDDIIRFKEDEFCNSPLVQLIEIETESDSYKIIRNESMCNILGINNNNLCLYQNYSQQIRRRKISFTRPSNPRVLSDKFAILANKEMFEGTFPIFEIRLRRAEKWSVWQAIAGKFIFIMEFPYPGGIAEIYRSIDNRQIENLKGNIEIRYSGISLQEVCSPFVLPRIVEDPFCCDLRKIIDPNTFHILFDSQIIHDFPGEKYNNAWKVFEERYR
ncbi:hypothetical protein ABE096_08725 [Robertmurraya massiliosenegalensis]|uniref:hypothetical protein n=1 Tax=Robertmurraya TaxID=2837507 RepID=UPI0039A638C0